MVFKNQKELELFIMKQSRQALMKAQDRVYMIIQEFLYQYYAEFTPKVYERTYQLLTSLVKSQIISDGKGYKAEVYVDLDYLNYVYPNGDQPYGGDIMHIANKGQHGYEKIGMTGGTEIWNEPIHELNAEAINILKNMLISEGIPIK